MLFNHLLETGFVWLISKFQVPGWQADNKSSISVCQVKRWTNKINVDPKTKQKTKNTKPECLHCAGEEINTLGGWMISPLTPNVCSSHKLNHILLCLMLSQTNAPVWKEKKEREKNKNKNKEIQNPLLNKELKENLLGIMSRVISYLLRAKI